MTDEQNKPVRSREEQAKVLISRINDMTMDYPSREIPLALAEAEARGAAEQRRKDAEGQEPVGYALRPEMELRKAFNVWPSPMATRTDWNVPLYSHPANVAALEGRIAELEGKRERLKREIQAMHPGSVRQVIHSPTRFMDDTRAALTKGDRTL